MVCAQLGIGAVDLVAGGQPRRGAGGHGAGDHPRGQLGFGRELRYRRARRRVRAARGRRPTISAGTAPGRSGCARSARRRSNTLPLGRFRSARRCRCTGVAYPRYSCPSSRRRSRRPPAPRRRRRDDRPHSYADRHAPRRRPTSPAPADAATGPGSRDRCSSASVQQFFGPMSETSPSINAPALRNGSHRENRGAIRSITSSKPHRHRSMSMLCAAAAAASLLSTVLTNSERCRSHRPYQRKHADNHRSTAVVLPGLRPSPTRHAAGLVCLGAPVEWGETVTGMPGPVYETA